MASFNDLDTLRQMGLVSLIYNGNHQLCLKFACAGTGITFTGSMDSALIIAAIKQQMTVDNIGLHGMIGPMGGMMVKDYDYDFIVWSNGGLKFGVNELSQIELIPVDHFEIEESTELIFVEPLRLPTVSWEGGDVGSYNWIYPHGMVQVSSGESVTLYDDVSVGQYVTYDSSKTYSYSIWYASSGGSPIYGPGFLIVNSSGYIAAKNNTSSTLNLYAMRIAVCSSSSATVITVYDSSNNPYNAFKYTLNGTDYYYVLDGTQTNWTDDLDSIGYHVPPVIDELEIIVGIRWDPSNQEWLAKTFSGASDWWWCGILNQSDISDLTELGVGIVTKSDVTTQWNGQIGAVEFNPDFDYSVEAMYSDLGQTQVTFNRDEFFIISKTSTGGNYDDSCLIHSLYATSTSVMAYKLKIKRGGNQNSCLYLQSDPLSMVESQWYPLYKMTGSPVEFTTQPSNVLGYFSAANEYDSLHLIPSDFTIEFRNNNNYLEVRQTNSLSQALNAAKIVVVWPSSAPALPTVSMSYAYPNQLWNYSVNIGAGASSVLRDQNGNALSYDSTKLYSALNYYTSASDSAGTIATNVSIGASGSFLALFNNGSSQITVQRVNVATCNSTDATVITVYDSSNNPYNAFKYTSNGTDYYYVLDGIQTDWTDDLSAIGYNLTVPLPTVSMVISYIRQDKSRYYTSGGTYYLYDDSGNSIPWDSLNKYQFFGTYESDSSTTIDSGEFYQRYQSIIESGGVVNYKNTGLGLYVQRVVFYSCASSSATVITVYNSSNNPYNAFKYTSDGTDYYYVLDGTQTDWTDDLSGIGYHLPAQTLELVLGFQSSGVSVISFSANDYWYGQLLSNEDKASLIDFGGEIKSSTNLIKATPSFFYEVADIYTGNGTGSIPTADLSNFRCAIGTKGYPGALNIENTNAYRDVMTWKVRITKVPNVAWVKSDKSSDWTGYAGSLSLYDDNGNAMVYDSTKTYIVLGYYTSETAVDLSRMDTEHNYGLSIINDSGYCKVKWADSSTTLLIQRVIYKVE